MNYGLAMWKDQKVKLGTTITNYFNSAPWTKRNVELLYIGVVILFAAFPRVLLYDLPPFLDNNFGFEEQTLKLLKGDIKGFLTNFEVGGAQAGSASVPMPLYSLLYAVIYALFGHSMVCVSYALNFFGVLSAVYVYKTSSLLFSDRRIALLSGIIYGINTDIVRWEKYVIHSDSFLLFWLILTLYLVTRATITDRPIDWIKSGLACGLSMLCKQVLQGMPVIILITLFIKYHTSYRKIAISYLLFLFPLLFITLPIVLFNYFEQKYFGLSPGIGLTVLGKTEVYVDYGKPTYPHLKANFKEKFLHGGQYYRTPSGLLASQCWQEYKSERGLSRVDMDAIFKEIAGESIKKYPRKFIAQTIHAIKEFYFINTETFDLLKLKWLRDENYRYRFINNYYQGEVISFLQRHVVLFLQIGTNILIFPALIGMCFTMLFSDKRIIFLPILLFMAYELGICCVLIYAMDGLQVPQFPFLSILAAYGVFTLLNLFQSLFKKGVFFCKSPYYYFNFSSTKERLRGFAIGLITIIVGAALLIGIWAVLPKREIVVLTLADNTNMVEIHNVSHRPISSLRFIAGGIDKTFSEHELLGKNIYQSDCEVLRIPVEHLPGFNIQQFNWLRVIITFKDGFFADERYEKI